MFELNIRDFNCKPQVDQTYDNFKKVMNKAYNEYVQKQKMMTKAGGYHSANMICMNEQIEGLKEQTMSHVTAMTETTTDAITNLANATQSDQTKLDSLARMLKNQQQMMQQLQGVLMANVLNNRQQPQQPFNRPTRTKKWTYYCHTHGYSCNPNHTSQTCTNPKDSHKQEATAENTMGGNLRHQKKYQETKEL